MRRLAVVAAIAVVAVAGGWFLLSRGGAGGGSASPAPSVPPVPSSTEVVADGRVVPIRFAELGVSVPGTIAQVLVAEGATVAAGDPLIRLDPAAANADVDGAHAAVAAAEANAARAGAGVTQAAAAVDAAAAAVTQARAGLDGARAVRNGLPSGAPTSQKRAADADVDAARAALAGARANERGARAAATAAGASNAAATADVDRAKAALDAAQVAREQLTIASPIAGTIASLDARAGERTAPGIPLVRIADTSGWLVETTDLDETTVARVAAGAPVTITFDGLPGVTLDGAVTSVALFGSTSQGDIVYRAVITPASLPEGLRWNMTATVTVQGGN